MNQMVMPSYTGTSVQSKPQMAQPQNPDGSTHYTGMPEPWMKVGFILVSLCLISFSFLHVQVDKADSMKSYVDQSPGRYAIALSLFSDSIASKTRKCNLMAASWAMSINRVHSGHHDFGFQMLCQYRQSTARTELQWKVYGVGKLTLQCMGT